MATQQLPLFTLTIFKLWKPYKMKSTMMFFFFFFYDGASRPGQNSFQILHMNHWANATKSAVSRAFKPSTVGWMLHKDWLLCQSKEGKTEWTFSHAYLHSFFFKLAVQYFVKQKVVFSCTCLQGNVNFWSSVMQHLCFVVLFSCMYVCMYACVTI